MFIVFACVLALYFECCGPCMYITDCVKALFVKNLFLLHRFFWFSHVSVTKSPAVSWVFVLACRQKADTSNVSIWPMCMPCLVSKSTQCCPKCMQKLLHTYWHSLHHFLLSMSWLSFTNTLPCTSCLNQEGGYLNLLIALYGLIVELSNGVFYLLISTTGLWGCKF